MIGGWSLSGVTSLRTGTPVMPRALFNNTGGFTQDLRVNLVPGVNPHVEKPTASQWFNAAAFVQPLDFSLGDGPRTHPSLRNPGFQNFDMTGVEPAEVAAWTGLSRVLMNLDEFITRE